MLERQKQFNATFATRILNSQHIICKAVGLVLFADGKSRWGWPLYRRLLRSAVSFRPYVPEISTVGKSRGKSGG